MADEVLHRRPWHRIDRETDAAWRAFMCYLEHPTRRICDVVRAIPSRLSSVRRWIKEYRWRERSEAYDLEQLDLLAEERRAATVRAIAMRERIEIEGLAALLEDYRLACRVAGDIIRDDSASARNKLRASRHIIDMLGIADLRDYITRPEDLQQREPTLEGLTEALSGLDEGKAAIVVEYLMEGIRNARGDGDP